MLAVTVEEISRYLDNKQQVDMLIFDFSNAFDTVPHTRLLRKLDHCGVRLFSSHMVHFSIPMIFQKYI
jgi:hypothetical protein